MNYYPHHIGDYLRDTAHLTPLEDGIYRRMLDVYYSSERPLPKRVEEIYRLVRATTRQEKLAVDIVVGEFFIESESGWRNKRADEEILKSKEKSDLARESANMRWHPNRNANAMRTHSEGNAPNNQKPITNNQKEKPSAFALPDWVPQDDWNAFVDSRKKLRKPMTDRARDLVLKKLAALRDGGSDPAAVLQESVRRGWLDLFPLKSAQRNESTERI